MENKQPKYKNNLKSYKYNSWNNIQYNLELILNENNKGSLQNPPLLVEELEEKGNIFSKKSKRALNPTDGLFYYSADKPALGETSNSM